ncbi:MAG: 50S ribosomal protein L18 [Candidatus Thermoplasmatota archaeon]|nr:50S ribosomal protein L18 [Candidatus Thermoplasmatota archaeon]|tara:strand:+ start:986 stop:1498 length:513 start_codon:yes stop_codon:yes gene_type:complete
MAHGKRQRNNYRRRLESKTDYHRRLRLLKSGLPRAVVRVSNTQITCQLTNYSKEGDKVVTSMTGADLQKHGYPNDASKKSVPASYLTGFALGKKAVSNGINEAVLDIGLSTASSGSRVFSALKGMIDAGLEIPHGEDVLPSDERINGGHISDSLSKVLDKTKKSIEGAFK